LHKTPYETNIRRLFFSLGTVVIKLGSEEPIASLHSGKVIMARGSDIVQANLKLVDEATVAGVSDGERMPG
jgi:coatomer subunit beta'